MRRDCRRFHREVLAAVDGELELEAEERLAEHAADCPECARRWRRLRRVEEGLLGLPTPCWGEAEIGAMVEQAWTKAEARALTSGRRHLRGTRVAAAVLLVGAVLATAWIARRDADRREPDVSRVADASPLGRTTTVDAPVAEAPPVDVDRSRSGIILEHPDWEEHRARTRARLERCRRALREWDRDALVQSAIEGRADPWLLEDLALLAGDPESSMRDAAGAVLLSIGRDRGELPRSVMQRLERLASADHAPASLVDLLIEGRASPSALLALGSREEARTEAWTALAARADLARGWLHERMLLRLLRSERAADRETLRRALAVMPATSPAVLDEARALYSEGLVAEDLAILLARVEAEALEAWASSLRGEGPIPRRDALNLARVEPRPELLPTLAEQAARSRHPEPWFRIVARLGSQGGWRVLLENGRGPASSAHRRISNTVLVDSLREVESEAFLATTRELRDAEQIAAWLQASEDAGRSSEPDLVAMTLEDEGVPARTRRIAVEVLAARRRPPTEVFLRYLARAGSAGRQEEELRLTAAVLVSVTRDAGSEGLSSGLAALGLSEAPGLERLERCVREAARRRSLDARELGALSGLMASADQG